MKPEFTLNVRMTLADGTRLKLVIPPDGEVHKNCPRCHFKDADYGYCRNLPCILRRGRNEFCRGHFVPDTEDPK